MYENFCQQALIASPSSSPLNNCWHLSTGFAWLHQYSLSLSPLFLPFFLFSFFFVSYPVWVDDAGALLHSLLRYSDLYAFELIHCVSAMNVKNRSMVPLVNEAWNDRWTKWMILNLRGIVVTLYFLFSPQKERWKMKTKNEQHKEIK